jgi:hypothetical protein
MCFKNREPGVLASSLHRTQFSVSATVLLLSSEPEISFEPESGLWRQFGSEILFLVGLLTFVKVQTGFLLEGLFFLFAQPGLLTVALGPIGRELDFFIMSHIRELQSFLPQVTLGVIVRPCLLRT